MMYVIAMVIEFFDDITAQVLDAGINGFIDAMRAPVWICAVLWLIIRAWQAVSGNLSAVSSDALKESIGLIAAVSLATNVDLFNQYVRDFFFFGVPSYLGGVAARIVGGANVPAQVGTMGEQLTVLWALAWREAGRMFQALSIWNAGDILLGLGIVIMMILAGAMMLVASLVYVISHFFLSIVVMLGPVAIGLSVFRATKPFVDRYVGKMVSLILVQVVAVLVLAVVCRGSILSIEAMTSTESRFVISRGAAEFWAGGSGPNAFQKFGTLLGMAFIFGLGAAAMYFVPQFAYSLGSGLMIQPMPSLPRPQPGGGGGGKSPALPPPDLGVAMNPRSGAIPQPPPQRVSLPRPPVPMGS